MILTGFTESDIPLLEKWNADEKISYYCVTEQPNYGLPFYSWAVRSNGELKGWANLFNVDMDNLKAEYGVVLPYQTGTRLGAKVTIEVLKFAFYDLKLNRVYIRPLKSNLQEGIDQRERFGFVREGIERQAIKRGEIFEDIVVMSILKDEFERKWFKCLQFQ